MSFTDIWSDWPNGTNGKWSCKDTFTSENGPQNPWDEADNFFV